MSTRKYTSVGSTSRTLLQYFSTTSDPWDHVTIPYTGQPTYHNKVPFRTGVYFFHDCSAVKRLIYTGVFCRGNSMQFLSWFETPVIWHWKLHLLYSCDFEVATFVWQKLHWVAATKIACVMGLKKTLLTMNTMFPNLILICTVTFLKDIDSLPWSI